MDTGSHWVAVTRHAMHQHGAFSAGEAVARGVPRSTVRSWARRGRVRRLHDNVYAIEGSPPTWHQSIIAAVKAAGVGAAASHRSAAGLWGLLEDVDDVEICVPAARRPRLEGVTVHRLTAVESKYTTVRDHVPTANPLLTMAQLGAVLRPWQVSEALERGLTARLFTMAAVEWIRTDLSRRGRDGIGVLGQILDDRALGSKRADGLLEPRMARLLRVHGIEGWAFQFEVVISGRRYRIDFAFPQWRLAIEVDGYRKRSSPEAMQRDLERQNDLVHAGWTVLRFTWHDVVRRPEYVARSILCALPSSSLDEFASW